MAKTLDIGIAAWSPLASGWLTGKYSSGKGNEAQESRRLDNEAMSAFVQQNERNLAIAGTVDRVAQQIGCSSAQVALNWLRQQGVIPIIGARKLSQVQNNLDCLNFNLSPEHLEELEQVSQIELGFPHDFLRQEMPRQFIYGGMFDSIDNHRFSQVR
jgi:aryl-alcohol dehydrogenase-like predicted oxidoreductase